MLFYKMKRKISGWNFIFYIFRNDTVWKKGSESIKIQFHVAFMTKNIERTVINVCFKMNLYFTNWQFYATLWSPKVNQDHCMCIVYVMFKMLDNKLFVENFYLLKIIIKKKTLNEARSNLFFPRFFNEIFHMNIYWYIIIFLI